MIKQFFIRILPLFLILMLNNAARSTEMSQSNSEKSYNVTSELVKIDTNVVSFTQNNTTKIWNTWTGYQKISGNFSVSISERFRSTLFQLERENKWKDDQNLIISINRSIFSKSIFTIRAVYNTFRDRQTGLFNDTETTSLAGGLNYRLNRYLRLNQLLGKKWDKRRGQEDEGIFFHMAGNLMNFNLKKWNTGGSLSFSRDNLNERRNDDASAFINLHREFYRNTGNETKINFSRKRRDYYISEGGEIESRVENLNQFQNRLFYQMSPGLSFNLYISFLRKRTDIESPINQPDSYSRIKEKDENQNSFVINYTSRKVRGKLKMDYRSIWEKYQIHLPSVPEQQQIWKRRFIPPDNRTSNFQLSTSLTFLSLLSDSITVKSNIGRLKYDTPDTLNFDDRDEFRFSGSVKLIHSLNRSLQMLLLGEIALNHFVYIFAERSADNHWNRIFRLTPMVKYKYKDVIQTTNSFNVLSNYFDYDFDSYLLQVRSLVFRNFGINSISWIKLSSDTDLQVYFNMELEDDGKLNWEKFIQQLVAERKILNYSILISYKGFKKLQLSPGISRYHRKEFRYGPPPVREKTIEIIKSFGPLFSLNYRPGDSTLISLTANRQKVDSTDKRSYFTNNLNLKISWLF